MKTLTVATLNLLNDLRRWEERRGMIVEAFRHTQPDAIALQEVVLPRNTAQWLANELGGYHVVLTPRAGRQDEGIAVLTRAPVIASSWIALGSQARVAQRVLVDSGHGRYALVNSHLYWSVNDSPARLRQVYRLQHWLAQGEHKDSCEAVVICGDFNGGPRSRAIRQMSRHYRSAYATLHGCEPAWTCPTPLQFSTQPWRRVTMTLAARAARRPGPYWRETLDYIFVCERVAVHACQTVCDHHAAHDPTLYPSDHLGLMATLSASGAQSSGESSL
jgi:endonuclease/exonuclease/phosphatase family metal-dependent hydrolase